MSIDSLPQIPALPTQPAPTYDQRMRDFEARMRRAEFIQREQHNGQAAERDAGSAQRHAQTLAATNRLAAAQERAAAAAERTLAEGIPTDQPMVDAIKGLTAAIGSSGGQPPAPAPEWLPELRSALQALLVALSRVQ